MTCTTQSWQSTPFEIIRAVHTFLDPASSRVLSSAEKRTRDAFYAALPGLVRTHFRCEPSVQLSPNDHHLALTVSRMPHAFAFYEREWIRLQGATTVASTFAVSPDLKIALSSCRADLFLWDLETTQLVHKFEGDKGVGNLEWILVSDLSPDKTWAVTSSEKRVQLWDLENKVCLKTLTEKKLLEAYSIRILPTNKPDEKKVVVRGDSLQIWDLDKETCLFNALMAPGHKDAVFSPDGEKMFFRNHHLGVTIQSLVDPNLQHVVNGENPTTALALNESGTKLYTADNQSIQIWDVNTRKLLHTIATDLWIEKIELSKDETQLIITQYDGSICIGHLSSGKIVDGFTSTTGNPCHKITADGTRLMIVDQRLRMQFVNLAPLPHEIIGDIASDCLWLRNNTILKFQRLPSFVKKNIGSKTVYPSHFHRGVAHQRLCEYSESDLLPNIAELFQRSRNAQSEKEAKDFNDSAKRRFYFLPRATKDLVYDRLFKIHVAKRKCKATAREDYGRLAFYNLRNVRSTTEERVMALKGIDVAELPSAKPANRKRKK